MVDKLVVPRRKVKKNWFGGLHPDPVDRTHPDVHDDLLLMEATNIHSTPRKLIAYLNNCQVILGAYLPFSMFRMRILILQCSF